MLSKTRLIDAHMVLTAISNGYEIRVEGDLSEVELTGEDEEVWGNQFDTRRLPKNNKIFISGEFKQKDDVAYTVYMQRIPVEHTARCWVADRSAKEQKRGAAAVGAPPDTIPTYRNTDKGLMAVYRWKEAGNE